LLLERGRSVGSALLSWGHVRVFSPWDYNIDRAARSLLEAEGWRAPDAKALPTGSDIVRRYLEPLAGHPKIAPHLVLEAAVIDIARQGLDKTISSDRHKAPFVVRWRNASGEEHEALASAVIDASGTWGQPNPMGIDGRPVPGERAAAAHISYGIPDVLGSARNAYAGRPILVVGAGHSAINVALDLLRLKEGAPGTQVLWALRRNRIERLLGGGLNDKLPERGALGLAAKRASTTDGSRCWRRSQSSASSPEERRYACSRSSTRAPRHWTSSASSSPRASDPTSPCSASCASRSIRHSRRLPRSRRSSIPTSIPAGLSRPTAPPSWPIRSPASTSSAPSRTAARRLS
jgi:hypothetical protein